MAAVENGHHFWIVIVAVLFAAISAYYYFRIIQAMYFRESNQQAIQPEHISTSFRVMLLLTVVLIILLGIYPEFLLGWMYH